MDALTVEVAGGAFRYRGAVHARFPEVSRWYAGLHEGETLWACREGGARFLLLDHRPSRSSERCRIELWEPVEPLDGPVALLLALAEERPGEGGVTAPVSLARLVARSAGAPATV